MFRFKMSISLLWFCYCVAIRKTGTRVEPATFRAGNMFRFKLWKQWPGFSQFFIISKTGIHVELATPRAVIMFRFKLLQSLLAQWLACWADNLKVRGLKPRPATESCVFENWEVVLQNVLFQHDGHFARVVQGGGFKLH